VRHGRKADRGAGEDSREQPLALPLGQLLRVGEAPRQPGRIEDHGGRDHRPGERPAADLVHPGDEVEAVAGEVGFEVVGKAGIGAGRHGVPGSYGGASA
jgi:hypothetical protein